MVVAAGQKTWDKGMSYKSFDSVHDTASILDLQTSN